MSPVPVGRVGGPGGHAPSIAAVALALTGALHLGPAVTKPREAVVGLIPAAVTQQALVSVSTLACSLCLQSSGHDPTRGISRREQLARTPPCVLRLHCTRRAFGLWPRPRPRGEAAPRAACGVITVAIVV